FTAILLHLTCAALAAHRHLHSFPTRRSSDLDINLWRANLQGANLQGANLRGANLQSAYLQGASLRGANLEGAILQGANLQGANLRGANLQGANLQDAKLQSDYLQGSSRRGPSPQRATPRGASLRGASLQGASLQDAYLQGANLRGAYLQGANLEGAKGLSQHLITSEGAVRGYKKVSTGIVTLEIPRSARRCNAIGSRKCRAEYAIVIDAPDNAVSLHGSKLAYRTGETVKPDSYDPDIRIECSHGIHFFLTREEAEEYSY